MSRGAFRPGKQDEESTAPKQKLLLAQAPTPNYDKVFDEFPPEAKKQLVDWCKANKVGVENANRLCRIAEFIKRNGGEDNSDEKEQERANYKRLFPEFKRETAFDSLFKLFEHKNFEVGMLAGLEKTATIYQENEHYGAWDRIKVFDRSAYSLVQLFDSKAFDKFGDRRVSIANMFLEKTVYDSYTPETIIEVLENPKIDANRMALVERIFANSTKSDALCGSLECLQALLKRPDFSEEMLKNMDRFVGLCNKLAEDGRDYEFSGLWKLIEKSEVKLNSEFFGLADCVAEKCISRALHDGFEALGFLLKKPGEGKKETLLKALDLMGKVSRGTDATGQDYIHNVTDLVEHYGLNELKSIFGLLGKISEQKLLIEATQQLSSADVSRLKGNTRIVDHIAETTKGVKTIFYLRLLHSVLENKDFKEPEADFQRVNKLPALSRFGGLPTDGDNLKYGYIALVRKSGVTQEALDEYEKLVAELPSKRKEYSDRYVAEHLRDFMYSIPGKQAQGILKRLNEIGKKEPEKFGTALNLYADMPFENKSQEVFRTIDMVLGLRKGIIDETTWTLLSLYKTNWKTPTTSLDAKLIKFRNALGIITKDASEESTRFALNALRNLLEEGYPEALDQFGKGIYNEAAIFNSFALAWHKADKDQKWRLKWALDSYASWFSRRIDEITERRDYSHKKQILGQMSSEALYLFLGNGSDEYHESNFTMPLKTLMERNKDMEFMSIAKKYDPTLQFLPAIFSRAVSNNKFSLITPKTEKEWNILVEAIYTKSTKGELAVLQRVLESKNPGLASLQNMLRQKIHETARVSAEGRALLYNFADQFSKEEFNTLGLEKPSTTIFDEIPVSWAKQKKIRTVQFFHPGSEYGAGKEYNDLEDTRGYLKQKGFAEEERNGRFVLSRKVNGWDVSYELAKGSPSEEDVKRLEKGEFSFFVHRGHSYQEGLTFTDKVLAKLSADTVLYNGSCGGFDRLDRVLKLTMAMAISTKGTGRAVVNDPLLYYTIEGITSGKAKWFEIGAEARERTLKDPRGAVGKETVAAYTFPHETKSVLFRHYLQTMRYELQFIPSQNQGEAHVNLETVQKAYEMFREVWQDRKKTAKAIATAARETVAEHAGQSYALGEWDCALFTREVFNKAVSKLFMEALEKTDPGKRYGVRTDIGKTTYEQWNSLKPIIERSSQSSVLEGLSEENVGDLLFHKLTLETVQNPTPQGLYGHVGIVSKKTNQGWTGFDNSVGWRANGANERPIKEMFSPAETDGGREALLIVGRPDFSKMQTRQENESIMLSTGGRYPIVIEVKGFYQESPKSLVKTTFPGSPRYPLTAKTEKQDFSEF